jgi:hypothetical protein
MLPNVSRTSHLGMHKPDAVLWIGLSCRSFNDCPLFFICPTAVDAHVIFEACKPDDESTTIEHHMQYVSTQLLLVSSLVKSFLPKIPAH